MMSQNVIFIANIFLKNYNADLKVIFYLVEISVPENFVRNLIGDETGVVLPDVDAVHHQVGNLALSFLQIARPPFKRKISIQFSLQRTLNISCFIRFTLSNSSILTKKTFNIATVMKPVYYQSCFISNPAWVPFKMVQMNVESYALMLASKTSQYNIRKGATVSQLSN